MLVELGQASHDIYPLRMLSQHPNEIVSLPPAHADCAHWTKSGPIQRGAHLPLHQQQPTTERGVGVLIVLVPCSPIHGSQ